MFERLIFLRSTRPATFTAVLESHSHSVSIPLIMCKFHSDRFFPKTFTLCNKRSREYFRDSWNARAFKNNQSIYYLTRPHNMFFPYPEKLFWVSWNSFYFLIPIRKIFFLFGNNIFRIWYVIISSTSPGFRGEIWQTSRCSIASCTEPFRTNYISWFC